MYTLSKRKHTLKLLGERLHYEINSGNYKQKWLTVSIQMNYLI